MIWVKWIKWMIYCLQKKNTHYFLWVISESKSIIHFFYFFREGTFLKAPPLCGHCAFGVLLAQMIWGKHFLSSPRAKRPGPKGLRAESTRAVTSRQKRCLIGFLIWGYQKFYSLPPKNRIFGPRTAKFGPKLAFLVKYGHFWPIWTTKKQCGKVA